jgi:hypothetical protein
MYWDGADVTAKQIVQKPNEDCKYLFSCAMHAFL